MTRVVSYYRVSSDEQAQKDLSIPAQRKALLRWIQEQPDCEHLREFVDEGESAYAPADRRPGLMEMLSFCKKEQVDNILVHKLDRFSRNREESIIFKSLLKRHGVTVKSITENYDPETPQGFLYEGMIEVINQFYSMNLATETMKGMRENAERGYKNGGRPPYGYRVEKVTDDHGREHAKLVPGSKAEIELVQEIYRLAIDEGLGAKTIAKRLNEKGVQGPASDHWSLSSVGNILNNRVYTGDTVWNRRSAKRAQVKPEDEWVVVENTHEPIIDRERWEKRKQLAAARGFNLRASPRRSAKYLLSRLIRCDHCGASYVGRRQRKKAQNGDEYDLYRYYCNSYLTKGKSVCHSVGIHKEWVEDAVLQILRREICAPERIAALEELVAEKIEARRKLYGRDPAMVDRKIEGLDRKIQYYYAAIGEGLDPDICRQHITQLEQEKAVLAEEAAVLRRDDYYRRALSKNHEALSRFAGAFDTAFEKLPFATQRQVVHSFVEEIRVIDREVVRISVRVPFDNNGIHHLTDEVLKPKKKASRRSRKPHLTDLAGFQLGTTRGAMEGGGTTNRLLGLRRHPKPASRDRLKSGQ